MRRLKIVHRTFYNFPDVVQLEPHRLLLRPRADHEVRIESSALEISPTASLRWLRDVYGNSVAIATFEAAAQQLSVQSEVIVQHFNDAPLDFVVSEYAVNYPFAYESNELPILSPFLQLQDRTDSNVLKTWVQSFSSPGTMQTYVLLQNICSGIHQSFTYKVREEPGVQTIAETLAMNTGSCRDFANLFMEAARSLGLAARFVSGYLYAPAAMAANAGATHAWAEVYLPGAGWMGFDPTLGVMTNNDHIAVAVARLPESVPPIAGSYVGPPGATLNVGVWVSELAPKDFDSAQLSPGNSASQAQAQA
ncbi:MAG TPA: transglutaminase family protein [Steroidobacteraceae bacterium]|nr:transglutaminase family protein [Steroidobacteraceae bacterium]